MMFYKAFADELMKLAQTHGATSAGPRAEMSPGNRPTAGQPHVGQPVKGLAAARKLTKPIAGNPDRRMQRKAIKGQWSNFKSRLQGGTKTPDLGTLREHVVNPGGSPKPALVSGLSKRKPMGGIPVPKPVSSPKPIAVR